jgi:hypothetical protein
VLVVAGASEDNSPAVLRRRAAELAPEAETPRDIRSLQQRALGPRAVTRP